MASPDCVIHSNGHGVRRLITKESMPTPTKIAIHGAAGRMGQRLVALGSVDDELQLTAALDAPHHPKLGEDAGLLAHTRSLGIPLTSEITQPVDVVIDFSIPIGAMSI